MNKKHLVLLSLGIYSLSMPLMVQATDPIIPIAQQEQLQQDRDTQRERSLRLDEERVETVASEPALIDVPSDQNGASFYIKQIQLDGMPKELSFLNKLTHKYEQKNVTVSDITNIRNAFQRKLLDKGFVTSQVYIPEQNLNDGILQLMVIPGRVEDIRYSESNKKSQYMDRLVLIIVVWNQPGYIKVALLPLLIKFLELMIHLLCHYQVILVDQVV